MLHSLTIIQISKYFSYERRSNGFFSRDNLPKIKGGAYVINLKDKTSKETNWVSLFIDRNTAVYFDSFGIEGIVQKYKMIVLFCKDFIVLL